MYAIIHRELGTPLSVKVKGAIPSPIVAWETIENALAYLNKMNLPEKEFEIVEVTHESLRMIASKLNCEPHDVQFTLLH